MRSIGRIAITMGMTMAMLWGMLFFPQKNALAYEISSRYAAIIYNDQAALKKFNRSLYMGRLSSQVPKTGQETLEDEVAAKINFIVEKTMAVLDMFPPNLQFSIVIHPDPGHVQQDFKKLYQVDVNYIAFYAPAENQVFFSADNARLRVVAHEIGHVVVENYFIISPPQHLHEVLAQYSETHITD
ncbi:MAG: hypothetical protein V2J08_11575 [Desulfotignum sp.]|jgi:hypothetical protein|nr:hypothetical protein [Desulfotignum sp.]